MHGEGESEKAAGLAVPFDNVVRVQVEGAGDSSPEAQVEKRKHFPSRRAGARRSCRCRRRCSARRNPQESQSQGAPLALLATDRRRSPCGRSEWAPCSLQRFARALHQVTNNKPGAPPCLPPTRQECPALPYPAQPASRLLPRKKTRTNYKAPRATGFLVWEGAAFT